ncbi:uncharacterized protein LOC126742416 [Anthonomus grandis grandis]|uniref:uncharacterized protein LOC126742416 n=1 Tax=Anthonomus grandis grandis TaxID=2921223 RepID=UPI00216559B1|nr:uncharacterized protein LOC126742416 [Anthonomus grandis grandis]
MVSLSYAFRIAQSTVSSIILETCNVLWDLLSDKVLCIPNEQTWLNIAGNFAERWQLPHCIGAVDGKHVVIQAPPNSGSTFYNYKGSHSIVLLALCDAKYKFIMVDIGSEGRHSDGGIFKNSNMGKRLLENALNVPEPSILIDNKDPLNYYIVADEAFSLSTYIMRPYPGKFLPQDKRIFNYRLSRGRRVIENAFGILAARWRIYRNVIISSKPTIIAIVIATICLHNFIIDNEQNKEKQYCSATIIDREDEKGNIIEGDWRREPRLNLLPVNRTSTNMYGRAAENMRNRLKKYFMEDGAVTFQWNK